ncbi:MAG: prolyl oligopeptidase family serine peptidase [Bacteroidia bacterium]|nr:prolyl oligopeptidase family serine peptidase [Bacteroidia bacterium]
MKNIIFSICLVLTTWVSHAQIQFQQPPKEIMELADVKAPLQTLISRNNEYLLLLERPLYNELEELAAPELRLAGLRINPNNFDQSRAPYYTGIQLQVLNGKNIPLKGLPVPLKAKSIQFSPVEHYVSFIQVNESGLSLWMIDVGTGEAKEVIANQLNNVMGAAYFWADDESGIYYKNKGNKTKYSDVAELPKGPTVQDATGNKSAARTYQDLLRNKQDETKFKYYTESSIEFVGVDGKTKNHLPPAIYKRLSPSPDNQFWLVETVIEPFSYTLPYSFFPTHVNILSISNNVKALFYVRPLQDKTPISFDAVEAGKRNIMWRNDKPATLIWCEAPDGGDPAVASEYRDVIYEQDMKGGSAKAILSLPNRLRNIVFGEKGFALVTDFWYKTRNTRWYHVNFNNGGKKEIMNRSSEDVYTDPGNVVTTFNSYNREVIQYTSTGSIYLIGEGYSPEGNKPFLDIIDTLTFKKLRIWQADGKTTYERIVRLIDADKKLVLTSIESPTVYPNLYLRNYAAKNKITQLTFRVNPYQSLASVRKQKIYYTRKDGVKLSATLYLPPGYVTGKQNRLPLLMEAYPTEFKDDKTAAQIKESPHAFIAINWASPVFWVLRGYAVLEDAQFPIIGKGNEEPNDTYIEQLLANAEAAIQTLDSMGIIDPKRCAVMGHSYGAFMTANLLAHSGLFAAGIARSGAYNRTLTPFGFQSEERSYWQAQEVYQKMSPFTYAHQLKTPILLIHGDADNNPGTFTLQSERLFQAIKGNGGIARLVLLPFESHGYAARENILHMLWEMDSWLEKYVKQK